MQRLSATEKLALLEREVCERPRLPRIGTLTVGRTAPMIGVAWCLVMGTRPPTAHDAQRRLVVEGGAQLRSVSSNRLVARKHSTFPDLPCMVA